MQTIYVYLSWTGWIWFIIAGIFLIVRLRAKHRAEAQQSHEQ